MGQQDLILHKSNTFTQNGEDGVIAAIFNEIGTTTRTCCEFGAWDGIHFSNCRKLILEGWQSVMIEGDKIKYADLVSNYKMNPAVHCVNRFVDTSSNNLASILDGCGVKDLDLLSVDIDGYDYDILKTMDVRPRVICIEVNAGHNPENNVLLDSEIAKDNIGQSMQSFVDLALEKGYDLVCYTGNAFFVRNDVRELSSLPVLSSQQAYVGFLKYLSESEKEWLYLVNLGLVPPYYPYANEYLTGSRLGISCIRAFRLKSRAAFHKASRFLGSRLRKGNSAR